MPLNWGGDSSTVGGGRFAEWNIPGSSHPVNTQPIMDAQLTAARGIIDAWVYAIYPDTEIDGNAPVAQSGINKPYYAHRASTIKDYVKRTVYLQSNWTGVSADQAQWTAWIANEMKDPSWWRIDGRPVICLFDPAGWDANSTFKTNWLAMKASLEASAGIEIYGIGLGTIVPTSWTNLKLKGGTSYDSGLGAGLSPNGQHAWADVLTKDQGNFGSAGFDLIANSNTWNDRRAQVNSESTTAWADTPTPFESYSALNSFWNGSHAKILFISPATELSEAGPNLPTVQDGTRWWDPIPWVKRPASKPATYTYKLDARHIGTAGATLTGTWTRTNGQAGAYDGDYICSSTTNDTASIVCNASVIGASASTGTVHFRVEQSTATGVADFTVAGVSQGTVDTGLASGGPLQDQDVKTVTCNLGDTVAIKVAGSHVLGSGNSVCIDNFQITGAP